MKIRNNKQQFLLPDNNYTIIYYMIPKVYNTNSLLNTDKFSLKLIYLIIYQSKKYFILFKPYYTQLYTFYNMIIYNIFSKNKK